MGIARAKGYMQTLGIINRVNRLWCIYVRSSGSGDKKGLPVIQEKIVCLWNCFLLISTKPTQLISCRFLTLDWCMPYGRGSMYVYDCYTSLSVLHLCKIPTQLCIHCLTSRMYLPRFLFQIPVSVSICFLLKYPLFSSTHILFTVHSSKIY